MKNCPICNEIVKKGQKITVVSRDLKCLGEKGEYNLIPDFITHEEIFHSKCFQENFSSNLEVEDTNTKIEQELYDSLRSLGEKVKIDKLREMILEHKSSNVNDLLQIYFKQK